MKRSGGISPTHTQLTYSASLFRGPPPPCTFCYPNIWGVINKAEEWVCLSKRLDRFATTWFNQSIKLQGLHVSKTRLAYILLPTYRE